MAINVRKKGKKCMDLMGKVKAETASNAPANEAEMAKYGITRSTAEYFYYRNFKYTNLNDALAQAKREKEEL